MDTETLEKSIIEKVPTIPYIVDQVGAAMKWTKETLPEDDYRKILGVALKVANYTSRTSSQNFFKTHLVIASLIANIEGVLEHDNFKIFDTASKSVENTCKDVIVPKELTLNNGCFKAISMHIVPLAKKDQDSLTIMLCGILQDLQEIAKGMEGTEEKAPITASDYVTILGYAWVIQNLMHSKVNLYNEISSILNEILILLNNLNY